MRHNINTTTRVCKNCGMVKRSRHEPENDPPHWTEFEHYGMRIGEVGKTPVCR